MEFIVQESGITNIIFENVKQMEYGEIINKYNDDWGKISKHQKLSESFIREYQDKVNWFSISRYQKFSKSFIREFKHKF
jgi:hypothetical protein